jgi:hypothetical protein
MRRFNVVAIIRELDAADNQHSAGGCGLAVIDRNVSGCHLTHETRVQNSCGV